MKKIIAIISALVIAAAMTACTAENDTTEASESIASTTAAETEASVETTETEATTTAVTETETEAAAEAVESIDDAFANKGDNFWTADLAAKINEASANVKIKASQEAGGIVTNIEIEMLGDKYVYYVGMDNILSSTQIFDGTNYYMVDGMKGTYCINPNGSEGLDNYMPAAEEMEGLMDTGIAEINGTKYIYEEYSVMGTPTRYYFDANKNIAHYSFDMFGEVTYMPFTVEFADTADETVFTPPADCTELSYDDYINQYME